MCCSCGTSTSDGRDGDGIRLDIRLAGRTRQALWAHIVCFRLHLEPEIQRYLDDAVESARQSSD